MDENSRKLIILITGASGSGKTYLTSLLPPYLCSTYNFDDIGVPTTDKMVEIYGSSEKWQEWATHHWIEKLSKLPDELIVLEGSFNPDFAIYKCQQLGVKHYLIICMNVERSIREKRLEERKQPNLATTEMENFAQFLKIKTLNYGGIIIDSSKEATEIVEEITKLIMNYDYNKEKYI